MENYFTLYNAFLCFWLINSLIFHPGLNYPPSQIIRDFTLDGGQHLTYIIKHTQENGNATRRATFALQKYAQRNAMTTRWRATFGLYCENILNNMKMQLGGKHRENNFRGGDAFIFLISTA